MTVFTQRNTLDLKTAQKENPGFYPLYLSIQEDEENIILNLNKKNGDILVALSSVDHDNLYKFLEEEKVDDAVISSTIEKKEAVVSKPKKKGSLLTFIKKK